MKNGTYRYSIEMSAPIGLRRGALELMIRGGAVGGSLTLFRQTRDISSGGCRGGSIRFAGEMRTLMYSLPYTADGTVSDSAVELVFRTEKGCFPATGRIVGRGKGDITEV